MNKYKTLFSPLCVKSMTLKNRIVMSPMGSNFARSDGQMSAEHIEYYRLRAAGGVGLIILENVCVQYPLGANGTTQLRLDQDCFIPQLYVFNETMHQYGCCTSVQINHAGCTAVPERIGTLPVSASRIPLANGACASELSAEEIRSLAVLYGKAAARAKRAGFDAVEIHGGHGYLINQFLSPIWNHRTDEFGGSLENRIRFCRLVIDEVRKAVGESYPVMLRLSLEEFTANGNDLNEGIKILSLLQDNVDIVDASVGVKYAMDVAQLPDGWRTFVSKAVKENCSLPCAVMGNIRTPQMAENILSRGEADLIVIGRGLLADPQWAIKAQLGAEESIRPCISCNVACVGHRMGLDRPIRCTVNPSVAKEEWHKTHQVKKACNVIVVGGGISGLEAACTAAETGCQVTLLEKEAELGGWLRKIAKMPRKFRIKRLLDYMLRRAENLRNLTCLTNVTATAELIEAFNPDLVVSSVGSKPLLPPIPGLYRQLQAPDTKVYDVESFLANLDSEARISGKRVALAGGGAVALDIAEFFAENNNQVIIVEQLPEIGRGLDNFSKQYITELLSKHGAEVYTSHCLEEVASNEFLVSSDGQTKVLPFDYGFICLGLTPVSQQNEMELHFEQKNIPFIRIGDGKHARRIFEGISEGRNIVELLKVRGFYQ